MGIRAQIERNRYPQLVQDEIVNKTPNLYVLEASVDDLVIENGVNGDRIGGCILDDGTVSLLCVIFKTLSVFVDYQDPYSYYYNWHFFKCRDVLRDYFYSRGKAR